MPTPILCSQCFTNRGLRLDAYDIGFEDGSPCPNCNKTDGNKLDRDRALQLAHRFFVWGSLHRVDYGAAPVIQFNDMQKTQPDTLPELRPDMEVLGNALGIGFFEYGPRLWMVGEVTPLRDLRDATKRDIIVQRILHEYPSVTLSSNDEFFRIRKNPRSPDRPAEYDSPPTDVVGKGRFDSPALRAMYGSQDLHVCIHECRVTAEDDLYVATLAPTRDLRLLDLTELLEENTTEFESLDLAVHMLFLAGSHSYPIAQAIAMAAYHSGFDGLIYPSYFSLLRTGYMPLETAYGLSIRRFSQARDLERSKTIPNLAIFGRPIEQGIVSATCINKLMIRQVDYKYHFDPVC